MPKVIPNCDSHLCYNVDIEFRLFIINDVHGSLFWSRPRWVVSCWLLLFPFWAQAQLPVLVKDINPTMLNYGSSPTNITEMGGIAYFTCYDGTPAGRLWRSDGTAAGTYRVTGNRPGGPNPSGNFCMVGNALFFNAYNDVHGSELWKSDGTMGGTMLVKDIISGGGGSAPANLVNINGVLFFTCDDGVHGRELWKSDGTADGTVMVKDICPGANSSQPTDLVNFNGTLFFAANDGVNGLELWKSDGTEAGTVMVRDTPAAGGVLDSSDLVDVNGTLFFVAGDKAGVAALWKSDGTTAGTVAITNIPTTCIPPYLINAGGTLFLTTYDLTIGCEWWKSDGTVAGTGLVKDIWSGSGSGVYLWTTSSKDMAVLSNILFFAGNDGVNGWKLWRSDGTANGTFMVKDIAPGSGDARIANMVALNEKVYFTASNSVSGNELWKSDGTAAGTVMVKDIVSGSGSSNPTGLAIVNGKLFFQANDGVHGPELWVSDGTASGTVMVSDIWTRGGDSNPANLTTFNGAVYFSANDGVHGVELWKSDGTAGGTVLVADMVAGASSSYPGPMIVLSNTLYIVAYYGNYGQYGRLWESDGTAAGTAPVYDFGYAEVGNIVILNGKLFFTITPGGPTSLWQSDGTTAGTVMVSDLISEGRSSAWPGRITVANGALFFDAISSYQGINSDRLWKSDGSTAGTMLVPLDSEGREIRGGSYWNFVNANGVLFFTTSVSYPQQQLFKYDPSLGPVCLTSYPPFSSSPSQLVNVDGTLFFQANDLTNGTELWKSDGTSAGTVLVKDIYSGTNISQPTSLADINGTLYFSANDGVHGFELWKSDGTEAGTVMIKEINSGNGDSNPGGFMNVNGTVFFAANNGVNGTELWRTDGTAAGTVMVADITGDYQSSNPSVMTVAGDNLFFAAQTWAAGNELYVLHLNPTTPFAGGDIVTTTRDVPASVTTNVLLQNDRGGDGGPARFAGVGTVSTLGGNVNLEGNEVVYTPLIGFSGVDSFGYTITNSSGGSARGTVMVNVLDTANPLHHICVSPTATGLHLTFTGIPANQYQLETTTNLDAKVWECVRSLCMDTNGVIELDLTNVALARFYRFEEVANQ